METRGPLAQALAMDAERAREMKADLAGLGEAAVLLATAFRPLTPVLGWQREAVRALDPGAWHTALTRAEVRSVVERAVGDGEGDALRSRLRRAVWALRARIALREVLPHGRGGADVDTTARELSHVADVAFDVALDEATRFESARHGEARTSAGEPSRIVALGMGKLGGLELNAGSDVDVNFVYDTDDGGSSISLHDHWTRVVRRAVETMEEPTEDGFVWRVDLRLRPEGAQGPLVNSVAATERYYETWGRLWERAALLRARPMAGDLGLGATVLREIVGPFVYRRTVEPKLATDLAEMVLRSRVELSEDPARDLKLGPGGIREAEFFVQALQLIWGGREPWLRVQSFFGALARLRSSGLVTDREQREILGAYWLLRRVEHAVQWTTGLQTHLVPASADEQAHLARVLGYADERALLEDVARAREVVAEHFSSLSVVAPRPPSTHQAVLVALERGAPATDEAAGLLDPDVFEHLLTLARRPDRLLGGLTRERHPGLADEVLDAVADAADPAQAARYLRSFFARFSSATPYVSVLAEDPKRVRRLVTTLGASGLVGDAVVSRPDLASVVILGGDGVDPGMAKVLIEAELESSRRMAPGDADDDAERDGFVGAMRRAKAKFTVEVAVADLAGAIDTRTATRRLSELADEILERTTSFARRGTVRGLCVIAMGKLGGRAIGYASDLDVLFVYDPDAVPPGEDAGEYFAKVAQRILRLLSTAHVDGPGYDLDTRLRPSGAQGLLVTSLPAFARYHGVGAQTDDAPRPNVLSSGAAWERQALLRARACAGDAELGARVIRLAQAAAYERGAPPAEEVHRLRLRMQSELAQERQGRRDLKAGVGGLLDVEFAVQWLQMRHGSDPAVRTTEIREALEALHAGGYLSAEHYEALRVGQTFLRRLEQRIHVQQGTSASNIDERAPGLPQLARRMGYLDTTRASGVERLVARHQEVSARVRAAYLGVLGLTEA